MPSALASRICLRTTSGSCDEYPTEICRGCPNQASYTASTLGGPAETRAAGRVLWVAAGREHPPTRKRRKSKAPVARKSIAKLHLRAAPGRSSCSRFASILEKFGHIPGLMTSASSPGNHGTPSLVVIALSCLGEHRSTVVSFP